MMVKLSTAREDEEADNVNIIRMIKGSQVLDIFPYFSDLYLKIHSNSKDTVNTSSELLLLLLLLISISNQCVSRFTK